MFSDVKQYREALTLLDAEDLDPNLKGELVDQIRYFEHDHPDVAKRAAAEASGDEDLIAEQRMLGGVQQSSRVEGSVEGARRAGLHVPRSRVEYGETFEPLKKMRGEYTPDTAQAMQEGLESAYEMTPDIVPTGAEPDPEVRAQVLEDFKAERAAEGGQEEDDYQAARRAIDEDYHGELVTTGLASINPQQPNASKRTDANLSAPPEFLPQGAGFMELAQAQPWIEPPLDIVKEIFKAQGHNVDQMTEQDPRYQRFADAAWTKAYNEAKAANKPLVRLDYMSSGDWKRQAYKAQAIALNEFAGPLFYGVDKSLTAGLVTEAMTGMMGEDARKAAHRATEQSPVVTGAGQVLGAFAPGGLAARVYGTAARGMVPAGAGAGRRILGASAAAGTTGAAESLASDLVRDAGEAVFAPAGTERYNLANPGDTLKRAVTTGVVAAPFGAGGEIVGSLAAKGVKALREGKRGRALSDLEQAGMTTGGFGGVRTTEAYDEIVSEAARRKMTPEELLADRLKKPISAEAMRRQDETVGRLGQEKADYFASPEGKVRKPASRILDAVMMEIDKLRPSGKTLPGRENDVRLLEQWGSKLTGKLSMGRELNPEELETVVEGLAELAQKAGDHNPGPFKRILGAALKMRDEFPKVGEAPMRRGGVDAAGNYSAMQMRHDVDLSAVKARNQAVGLPPTLKSRAEAAGTPGPSTPALRQPQDAAFTGALKDPRATPERFDQMLELAGGAGVEKELRTLAASRAVDEVREATKVRSVVGSQGSLASYTSNPGEVALLRLDPMMRALSRRESTPDLDISENLMNFLKRVTFRKNTRSSAPIDPLRDIAEGRAGRGSARQFGASGAPQEQRKRKFSDLTMAEREALLGLLDAMQRAGQLPQAVGE